MPQPKEIAVIGGGVVGASTAWYLANYGCKVVLINVSDEVCDTSGENFIKYEIGAHFSRMESAGEFVPI